MMGIATLNPSYLAENSISSSRSALRQVMDVIHDTMNNDAKNGEQTEIVITVKDSFSPEKK
jgi:hypothetical protein